jgi:DivIVA domain-containing protein
MVTLVLVSILGAVILGALGWLLAIGDDSLPEEEPAGPDLGPVDGPLRAADLPALRFRLAFRGYRMSDVDAALSRITEAMNDLEARPRPRTRAATKVTGNALTEAADAPPDGL